MPITLPALSRRRFLQASVAGTAGLCLSRASFGDEIPTDSNRFALLSDTHIAADRNRELRGANMAENLQQVSNEVCSLSTRPAAVLVDGDCALLDGQSDDYKTLLGLFASIREAGMPVHLALGNHDHRERFWAALGGDLRTTTKVADRQVLVVPSPHANWFILDSLNLTNKTPGVLGEKQLAWLGDALDAAADKPALVVVHHNPDQREKPSGLTDTQALLDIMLPRRHVKALFYGHSHNWKVSRQDDLHLINLPPVAYVFSKGRPSGWVDANVSADGIQLELRALDREHPEHGKQVDLQWRT